MVFRQLATREATLSYLFGCGSCADKVLVFWPANVQSTLRRSP